MPGLKIKAKLRYERNIRVNNVGIDTMTKKNRLVTVQSGTGRSLLLCGTQHVCCTEEENIARRSHPCWHQAGIPRSVADAVATVLVSHWSYDPTLHRFEIMSLHFTEDEFQAAWRELDAPQVEGWELFTETMGVKIYRRYSQVGERGKKEAMHWKNGLV